MFFALRRSLLYYWRESKGGRVIDIASKSLKLADGVVYGKGILDLGTIFCVRQNSNGFTAILIIFFEEKLPNPIYHSG